MRCFSERYEWLLEQIQIWGAKIYQIDAAEHDHNMTYIQALRHFSTFANGLHLSKQPVNLSNFIGAIFSDLSLGISHDWSSLAQDAALFMRILLWISLKI